MWIGIIAIIIFIALVAINFLKINKKLFIMAGLIIALLILHIADELISPTPHIELKKNKSMNKQINMTTTLYKNSPTRVLLK